MSQNSALTDFLIDTLFVDKLFYLCLLFITVVTVWHFNGNTSEDYMDRFEQINDGKTIKVLSLVDAQDKCSKLGGFPPSIKYLENLYNTGKLDKNKEYAWISVDYTNIYNNIDYTPDNKIEILGNYAIGINVVLDPYLHQKIMREEFFNASWGGIDLLPTTYMRDNGYTFCLKYKAKLD